MLPVEVAVGTGMTTHLPLVSDGVAVFFEFGSGFIRTPATFRMKLWMAEGEMPVGWSQSRPERWPPLATAAERRPRLRRHILPDQKTTRKRSEPEQAARELPTKIGTYSLQVHG